MKKSSLDGPKFGFKLALGLTCLCLGFFIAMEFLTAITIRPAMIDLPQNDGRWVPFYDFQQKKFIKIFVRDQSKIRISQMPTLLQKAVVQKKDSRFYNHNRSITDLFDIFIAEIKSFFGLKDQLYYSRDIPATLAYNNFMIRKKKIPRYLDEAILAYKIEQKYRKEEIMECYLNNIYFGEGNFGVEAAAKYYFKKNAVNLQPHEIAFLITLVTDTLSPDIYKKEQMLHNPKAAKNNRDQLLMQMANWDMITLNQAEEYKRKPLGLAIHN